MPVGSCNPDYHGGMICRADYGGTKWEKSSACSRHGGPHICLLDIKTPVKRDWILVASDRKD